MSRPEGRPAATTQSRAEETRTNPDRGELSVPQRVATGVVGLDAMLGGGLMPGDATLVAGSPGTGKTTLGTHFLVHGAQNGEPGIMVTFEYLPQQIYRDAAARGWDLPALEDQGLLKVICLTPDILLAQAQPGVTLLDEAIRDIGAKRLVLDSMSHFSFYDGSREGLRDDLAGLLNHLRFQGVTSILTHEIPQIVGPAVHISEYGLEFLVDAVILLRYVELDASLEKAVNILKFRGGSHDRSYRRLTLDEGGFSVHGTFEGVEGISSGSARHSSIEKRARRLI